MHPSRPHKSPISLEARNRRLSGIDPIPPCREFIWMIAEYEKVYREVKDSGISGVMLSIETV